MMLFNNVFILNPEAKGQQIYENVWMAYIVYKRHFRYSIVHVKPTGGK